jgi:O-antigen ligase
VPSAAPVMMSHYATILTETGLLGALCVLAFAGAVLVELWRSRRRMLDGRLTAGVAAALAAYALAGTATALVVYQSLLIWLLLAAALTLQPTRQGNSVPLGGRVIA